jgi:hypothetical protein
MFISGGWHLEYDPTDPDAEPVEMPSWGGSLEVMPDVRAAEQARAARRAAAANPA